jgi:hypothetical protein
VYGTPWSGFLHSINDYAITWSHTLLYYPIATRPIACLDFTRDDSVAPANHIDYLASHLLQHSSLRYQYRVISSKTEHVYVYKLTREELSVRIGELRTILLRPCLRIDNWIDEADAPFGWKRRAVRQDSLNAGQPSRGHRRSCARIRTPAELLLGRGLEANVDRIEHIYGSEHVAGSSDTRANVQYGTSNSAGYFGVNDSLVQRSFSGVKSAACIVHYSLGLSGFRLSVVHLLTSHGVAREERGKTIDV